MVVFSPLFYFLSSGPLHQGRIYKSRYVKVPIEALLALGGKLGELDAV